MAERPQAVEAVVKLLPQVVGAALPEVAVALPLEAAVALPLEAAARLLEAAGEALLPEVETAEGQRPSTEPAVPTEAARRAPSDRPIKSLPS